jgi:DNA adenine methylase
VDQTLSAVRPCEPVAAYIGGKRVLAARIIQILSDVPHHTYAEPFVGMGGVFLRRQLRARAEVINDISTDVATLFRVLQRHYVPLMDMLRWQLTSREQFDRLVAAHADSLTDLERAARFLYLQRTSFGGKVAGRNFGVSPASSARFDVGKLETILLAVHERLSGVVIERLPWRQFIPRYDRPETLFYLDPPYYGSEGDYGAGVFHRQDFEQLAEVLATIKGRFLLSLNDHPEVRRIFSHFDLAAVETTYSIGGPARPSGRARELLISRGL